MLLASALAVVLFMVSLWLHRELLRLATKVLGTGRLQSAHLIVLASHLAVTTVFAAGLAGAERAGLGGFSDPSATDWMDIFYFSLVNITTLGLGDVYPTGHLRVIAGIESLTGFLVISCTAQWMFESMKTPRPRKPHA